MFIIRFLGVIAMIAGAAFIQGAVFQQMWTWFIELPFNAPHLGLWQAAGIAMTVRWMTFQFFEYEDNSWGASIGRWFTSQIGAMLICGMGWVFVQLM